MEMALSEKVKEKVMMKPDQLLFDMLDIFSRLPVKSLSRFRCVSKGFCSFLSTPDFHRLHSQRSSKNPFSISMALLNEGDYRTPPQVDYRIAEVDEKLLLCTADHEGRIISQFTPEIKIGWHRQIFFVPSHYNLVCVVTGNHIYVCNPSKQEFVELPKGSDFRSGAHTVGFGYMPSKNEYKVVRCFYRNIDYDNVNNFELGCEILTISNYGTNNSIADCCSAWRMLEEGCPHLMEGNPALVNGSLHWKIDLCWERGEDEQILSFDLEADKFWILPIPPCVIRNPETFNLAELRQDLWLSHYDYSIPHVMDMWVLKDFEKFTWVKVYSIDFSPINTSRGKYEITFVLNIRNEELLILMNCGRLAYYNLKTKSFTDLGAPWNGFNFCYYTDVVSFH